MRVSTARLLIAALCMGSLFTGCAKAIVSHVSRTSHQAYNDADLARFKSVRSLGTTRKGEVLAPLGPPIEVIGQDTGDIFVYRRRALQTNVINLNPGMVSGFGPTLPIPLYYRSTTTGREDTLMLFFDAEGLLQGESLLRGIDGYEEEPGK